MREYPTTFHNLSIRFFSLLLPVQLSLLLHHSIQVKISSYSKYNQHENISFRKSQCFQYQRSCSNYCIDKIFSRFYLDHFFWSRHFLLLISFSRIFLYSDLKKRNWRNQFDIELKLFWNRITGLASSSFSRNRSFSFKIRTLNWKWLKINCIIIKYLSHQLKSFSSSSIYILFILQKSIHNH